jgi:hypothetical protein
MSSSASHAAPAISMATPMWNWAIWKDDPYGTLTLQNCVIAYNSWPDPTQATHCCNLGYPGGENPGGAAGQLFLDRTCLYPELQDVAELWMGAYFPQLIVDEPGFPQGWDSSGNVRLADGSPLIDFGNNYADTDPTTPGVQFLPEFDLDGNPRIVDGDGDGLATVDIGAFEVQVGGGTP